jgi:hypothetical protein
MKLSQHGWQLAASPCRTSKMSLGLAATIKRALAKVHNTKKLINVTKFADKLTE